MSSRQESFYGGITPTVVTAGTFNLGQEFIVDADGVFALSARFYMTAAETGTHTARLYTDAGELLASLTFSGEAEGWNEAEFAAPVPLANGATYRIAVNANVEWPRHETSNPSEHALGHTGLSTAYFNDDAAAYPDTQTTVPQNGFLRDLLLGGEPVGPSPGPHGSLEETVQAIADALQPITSQIPELQIVPRAMSQATPPCIDIYPAREFQRGMGMGVGNTRVWFTVRARVSTVDDVAANSLLLRLLDPNGPASVEAALATVDADLDNDQGLITGFEVFPDSGGDLLGCTWTVGVFL